MRFPAIALPLLAIAGLAARALAHDVALWAEVRDGRVWVEAYDSEGGGVANAAVSVEDTAGKLLLEGKTDEKGKFDFAPPSLDGLVLRLVLDSHHKSRFVLDARELQGLRNETGPGASGAQAVGAPTPAQGVSSAGPQPQGVSPAQGAGAGTAGPQAPGMGSTPGAAPGSTGPQSPDAWAALVRSHLVRYPQARAQDLYKLLHQGTMGAEHAVPGAVEAERYLVQEMDALEADATGPAVEPVDPEGRLVRVHLRPYKAAGGSAAALARAFVQTATEVRPDPQALGQALASLQPESLGATPGTDAELRELAARMAQQGYPALSHSDAYRQAYRPAYRVILARLVPGLGVPRP